MGEGAAKPSACPQGDAPKRGGWTPVCRNRSKERSETDAQRSVRVVPQRAQPQLWWRAGEKQTGSRCKQEKQFVEGSSWRQGKPMPVRESPQEAIPCNTRNSAGGYTKHTQLTSRRQLQPSVKAFRLQQLLQRRNFRFEVFHVD
eukprot:GHVU01198487.1.p2 GENE.GHVU01198487.1~~GHVU01198487.1.p2  ORF type:complete len:144 (+),score=17.72 GHVU01198487.1:226-657(+)